MIKNNGVKWKLYVPYIILIALTCYFAVGGLQKNINRSTTILLEKATVAMILAVPIVIDSGLY